MKFNIHKLCCGRYYSIGIETDNATLDLGVFNDDERDELARILLDAVWRFGPSDACDFEKWLAHMLSEYNINIIDKEAV